MKKLALLLVIAAAAAAILWGVLRNREPVRVNFVPVKQQTLVSALATNGRVEPFEWQTVHAPTSGLIGSMNLHEGQPVVKDAEMATISDPEIQAEIESAEAKLAQARANLAALEAGGRPSEFTDIDNNLARVKFDLQRAQNDLASLRRLMEKQAATGAEVKAAEDKVQQIQIEMQGLAQRRTSLVAQPDLAAAQAHLRDVEVAVSLARQRGAQSVVRAPITGIVYGLTVRAGGFVRAGDPIASIGQLDRVRVRVYVDEPELGRVVLGQPVTIRWQALSGKEWHGTVERKPTSIQAMGSRQVGEVVCTVDNPGRDLIPGTNVDAEIRTAVVANALVIPREALRHDANGDYVLSLSGDVLVRRSVKTGESNVSLVEIASGLANTDSVALPTQAAIKPGDRVTPVQ